jgi:hypothetical protein
MRSETPPCTTMEHAAGRGSIRECAAKPQRTNVLKLSGLLRLWQRNSVPDVHALYGGAHVSSNRSIAVSANTSEVKQITCAKFTWRF